MNMLKQTYNWRRGFLGFIQPRHNVGAGFTIIELLVVLSVMGILITLIVANLAGQRSNQKLKIAQNELVTNFRKLQSFTLASRNLPDGQSVQYYILKFDLSKPDRYTIEVLYDVLSSPGLASVETVFFPEGIRLAVNDPIVINRPSVIPTQKKPAYPNGCALVAFKLPFAKTLISYASTDGCKQDNWNPSTDDYEKIINFVINVNNYPVSADSEIIINLADKDGKLSRSVSLDGVTGLVNF